MKNAIKVFMVEDDRNFGSVLKSYLEIHDFNVVWVDDGKKAFQEFMAEPFNICILDVMLPHVDGFTIATDIRKINSDIPIIFLTAKTLKADVLHGFKVGADDYITKPFDSEVLLCKINAIIKRHNIQLHIEESQIEDYKIGKYHFNFPNRIITRNGETQKLSPKEAELLKMLCRHINNVLPRETALKTIWGEDNYFTTRSMDVFITKLRKYLKDDPNIEIINLHGSGFRLEVHEN